MPGDVARHQGRPDPPGAEPGVLDIDGPHHRSLVVVQHWQVDRPRRMVLGELGRTAHVDQGVEAPQGLGVGRGDDLDVGHDDGVSPGYRGPAT